MSLNELTPEELDVVIRALGECKLPSKGSVSVTALIQRFKKAKEAPHPFNEPRLQSWIRKSLS
jgi:hypothetical protein|tara:strand:+ start:313 stop:501 length:189 start_codon:yes stop_codon:yes gene_type:complete